jgi:hypothetical protein
MSHEDVKIVRSIFKAWERGDFRAVDWAHPEIEFGWMDGPSPGRWKGLEALSEAWGEWLQAWADFRAAADEYRTLAQGRVLALNSFGGRGRTSGVGVGELMTRGASVFCLDRERVTRLDLYWDRDRALVDLGLKE